MKRIALVIDNKDPNLTGKIKVRILPEMQNVSEDLLPWASPSFSYNFGLSNEEGNSIHKIPEQEFYIYCEISEDWTSFTYLEELPYSVNKYSYEDILELIQENIEELGEQEYPQPSYFKTKDGTISFKNTKTGEQGFFTNSEIKVHLREDGTLKLQAKDTSLEVLENGSVSLEAEGFKLLFDNDNKKLILTEVEELEIGGASDVAVLFGPLKEILEKLLDHNHVAPTGPTTPAQESSGTPLSSLKGKLQDLKSIIKTD